MASGPHHGCPTTRRLGWPMALLVPSPVEGAVGAHRSHDGDANHRLNSCPPPLKRVATHSASPSGAECTLASEQLRCPSYVHQGRNRASVPHRRRGSAYLVVLGTATIVAIIGLSSVMVARLHHRTNTLSASSSEARFYAQSMAEAFIGGTKGIPTWRTFLGVASGEVYGPVGFGNGQCYISLVDEDGDLGDDLSDGVEVYTTAEVGDPNHGTFARYSYCVKARPASLTSLTAAILGHNSFTVHGGGRLNLDGGPAVCDEGTSSLFAALPGSMVDGDVMAEQVIDVFANITGTITRKAPNLTMPDPNVFTYYRGMATEIPWGSIPSGKFEKAILSHTQNPYGATNPNGLYYINTQGNDLTIELCRLKATLILSISSGKELKVEKSVHWEPHNKNYPALILSGNAEFKPERDLSESEADVNFNPADLPYETHSDTDKSDSYPSIIKGLVHIIGGSALLEKTAAFEGCVLVEGSITVEDFVTVERDSSLAGDPPSGYSSTRLTVIPGTWRRVTDPNEMPLP